MGEMFRKYWIHIAVIIGYLILLSFVLLYISEAQIPTELQSNGVVAIISAFLGVILTVAVTAMLLQMQNKGQKELLEAQSEKESRKDKDVKIYEHKISVYSSFIEKMWAMLDKWTKHKKPKEKEEELNELKKMCFSSLVFYLNKDEIDKIIPGIEKIDVETREFTLIEAFAQITQVLHDNLNEEASSSSKSGDLIKLYNAFTMKNS